MTENPIVRKQIDERLAERYLIDEILENDLDHPERRKLLKRDMELAWLNVRDRAKLRMAQYESISNTSGKPPHSLRGFRRTTIMLSAEQKIEAAVLRIKRMRQFRAAFERRDYRVLQGEEDTTERSMRCCNAMIRHLEDEVVSLRKIISQSRQVDELYFTLGPSAERSTIA